MCLLYRVLILQAAATDIRVRGLSFLDSEHMSAQPRKSLHSTTCSLNASIPQNRYTLKSSKSSQHWRPRAFHLFPPRLVMSFTRILGLQTLENPNLSILSCFASFCILFVILDLRCHYIQCRWLGTSGAVKNQTILINDLGLAKKTISWCR